MRAVCRACRTRRCTPVVPERSDSCSYLVLLCVQAVEAMRLGNDAAKFVSAAFPRPMELKFERVAQPFLLLHVNRCSACSLLALSQALQYCAQCPAAQAGCSFACGACQGHAWR